MKELAMTSTAEELALLDDVEEFDDFEEVIVHRRRMMTPVTWGLLFALGAALAFVGGVKLEKSRAATSVVTSSAAAGGAGAAAGRAANAGATTTTGGARGASAAGAGGAGAGAAGAATAGGGAGGAGAGAGGGQGAGGGGQGGATVGQVKLVDGTNVYVQDQQGNIVKVTTAPDVVVTVSKPGTVVDLKPGDTVLVRGQPGTDGTVAATSVATTNGLGGGLAGRAGRNGGGQASGN
jgi:hypothetical protein